VRLVDTAGLWDAPDPIDRLGVDVSRRYLAAADLVLLCVETGRAPGPDESAVADARPTLLVRTKADLSPAIPGGGLPVSAVAGTGLGELRRTASEQVFGGRVVLADLEPALGRARQRTALARARAALGSALDLFRGERDAVLVAHHVRDATVALDELIGSVDVDDVLDGVFATFCVGK